MAPRTKLKAVDNSPEPWQFYLATTVVSVSVLTLVSVFMSIDLDDSVALGDYLKIPRTVGDAKHIGSLILKYKDEHYYSVFGAYFASYILLQSFCIPGSIVLSLLAGYLFPAPLALLIICTCSTLGASNFYIIVYKRKELLLRLVTGGDDAKVDRFKNYVQEMLDKYKSNLFLCIFILRATPVFPNWFINLCSPIINLPLKPFVLGTFTGVAPLSVIHVWTGRILNDLSNDQSLLNWQSILMTSLLGLAIALLIYIRRIS